MKKAEELLISRHLDGDLNSEEAELLEHLMQHDSALRDRFLELSQVRQSVASLPRVPIPEDMLPRVKRLIESRKTILFPLKTAELLGRWAVAALVLVVSGVSITAYLNHQQNKPASDRHVEKIFSVPANEMVDQKTGDASAELANIADSNQMEKPERTAIDIAKVSSAALNEKISSGDRSRQASAKIHTSKESAAQVNLPADFQALLKATESLDRRHSLRVHVASANTRVVDKIISLLEKYRVSEVGLARLRSSLPADQPPSLDFLAFVPTNLVDDLSEELNQSFPGQIERDLPQEKDWHTTSPDFVSFLPRQEIQKAIANANDSQHQPPVRPPVDVASRVTLGPNRRGVGNAIREPLENLQLNSPSNTVDQLIIEVRSDLQSQKP